MKNRIAPKTVAQIIMPVILVIILIIQLFDNYKYNNTARIGHLDAEHYKNSVYDFGDVSVWIGVRGGESSAWLKDSIYDDAGNLIHGPSVGIIYEALIYNNSEDTVSEWKLKVPINEPMWINNSWNSKLEIHQDVKGDEKVLAIDLSDYYEYDINLDYYTDHTGPMIPLYQGDYFIYLPEEIAEEKPIKPSPEHKKGEACARFGYIVYIPNQGVDYSADFSGGEIEYYMHANPFVKEWFWTIIALLVIWFLWVLVTIIVDVQMKKLIKQQKAQKLHDREMVEQTMQLIINMIETKDENTKGHSIRVAAYARLIADKLGYSEDECQRIYYIGLMHDCGKINIPNAILKKPGRLTDEEYATMKLHTVYGGEILKDFTSIKDIGVGAKYHHERYDGKGYPNGLIGEKIPEVARIIGIADAFDAMNSKRCYRDRLTEDIIMKELKENSGKQFDPEILKCFLELLETGEIKISQQEE